MLQKSDLARMYRLFQRIPKGLEPVAESFKKHVESEGMKLVKEATEAATAKKDKDAGKPSKDSGTAHVCAAAKAPSTVQVDLWSHRCCMLQCCNTHQSQLFMAQAVMLCVANPCVVVRKLSTTQVDIAVAGSAWEQHFVREVIELHDKYMLYVSDCFANSSLFHKALKEAFEFFCNKNVAGSSTAELMANFCDNLLRKVGAACIMLVDRTLSEWHVSHSPLWKTSLATMRILLPVMAYLCNLSPSIWASMLSVAANASLPACAS